LYAKELNLTALEVLIQMKCPADFDYLDPAVQSDPMEFLAVLREQAPVYREPRTGAFIVTRAKDIRYISDHPEIFSNCIDPTVFRACQGLALEEKDPEVADILRTKAWLAPNTLLMNDPPVHGRYRRLALEALSPKAVKTIQPFIEQQIAHFLAPFDCGDEIDFVAEFCERLPLSIIMRFLNAPQEDCALVNSWTHQFFSTIMGQTPRDEYLKTVDVVCDMYNYVARRIEQVRLQRDGSLLDVLMHAHEATGDEALTIEELLSIFQVLLMAGHDTTRQTLGNSVRVLATNKTLYKQLQDNPDHITSFVEEVIRLYSPSVMSPRVAAQDTELAGVAIPKGATLFVSWGSANRDPEVFANPDEFKCPSENAKEHYGFGYGQHFCVGSRLARAQLTSALRMIVNRYSDVSLTVPESELRYTPTINLRALVSLPVRCTLKH
jgi:cytochrome P450